MFVQVRLANLEEVRRGHEHFLGSQERIIQHAMELGGQGAVEHVQNHPDFKPRTGALQKATKSRVVRIRGGKLLRISNTKSYGPAIDTGARPHVIRPRRRKFLRFITKQGQLVFTRKVNHPGNRPFKFLYNATDAAYRVIGQDLHRRLGELASRF